MPLSTKQRGVVRGVLSAALVTVAAFTVVIAWPPSSLLPAADFAARMAFVVHVDLAVAACLAVTIGALARHRFFTPEDIDGGGLTNATGDARTLQAVIQNTLEQSVLAVLAHLAWAATVPRGWMAVVPVATVLFVLGRVLFWRGYAHGAPSRAIGFGLTFYPSVLMIAAAIAMSVV